VRSSLRLFALLRAGTVAIPAQLSLIGVDPIDIPRAVNRNEVQRLSIGPGPTFVNHLRGHVSEGTCI